MALVDQQKIRRSRTGLIAHDPARAQAGYTLFAPMLGDGTVFLVDMDGKVAHTWRPPFRPGLYGYLLDNGHLFYGGKVMDDLGRFEAWPRFKGGAVLEVDWHGRILWELRHPDHHHDARRLRNGNVLLLCLAPLPAHIAAQVRGGLPGHRGRRQDLRRLSRRDDDAGRRGLGVAELGASRSRRLSPHASRSAGRVDPRQHGRRDRRRPHRRELSQYLDGRIDRARVRERRLGAQQPAAGAAARSAPAAQRPPPHLRQRHSPAGSSGDLLARDRGRSAHERDRVGVHRPVALRVLQPVHLGRPAAGQRQHPHLRGMPRPDLRGDARRARWCGST